MQRPAIIQFRLSTALVLMLVISALLGLNIVERTERIQLPGSSWYFRQFCYGWPIPDSSYLRYRMVGDVGLPGQAALWALNALCWALLLLIAVLAIKYFERARLMRLSTACCALSISALFTWLNLAKHYVAQNANVRECRGFPEIAYVHTSLDWNFYPHHAATNLVLAFMIVCAAGCVCEWAAARLAGKQNLNSNRDN